MNPSYEIDGKSDRLIYGEGKDNRLFVRLTKKNIEVQLSYYSARKGRHLTVQLHKHNTQTASNLSRRLEHRIQSIIRVACNSPTTFSALSSDGTHNVVENRMEGIWTKYLVRFDVCRPILSTTTKQRKEVPFQLIKYLKFHSCSRLSLPLGQLFRFWKIFQLPMQTFQFKTSPKNINVRTWLSASGTIIA